VFLKRPALSRGLSPASSRQSLPVETRRPGHLNRQYGAYWAARCQCPLKEAPEAPPAACHGVAPAQTATGSLSEWTRSPGSKCTERRDSESEPPSRGS
jgi:hypothetical protein